MDFITKQTLIDGRVAQTPVSVGGPPNCLEHVVTYWPKGWYALFSEIHLDVPPVV